MTQSLDEYFRDHEPTARRTSWQAWLTHIALFFVNLLMHVGVPTRFSLRLIRGVYALFNAWMRWVPAPVIISPQGFGHFSGEWVRARRDLSESKVILYLHGGGYFFASPALHRPITWRLSYVTRRPVLAIDYRMAPDFTIEDARDDAVTAYRFLLDAGYGAKDIIIGGDSAGGHLTLLTLQTLRDRGLPLPRLGLCISPWADLSCESPSYAENRWRDPMLAAPMVRRLARFYVRDGNPYNPVLSPLHGDMHGLPPLMIITGDREILRDDGKRLAERARGAGVPVHYIEWPEMTHVFMMFSTWLPEGRASFRHIGQFVRSIETQA